MYGTQRAHERRRGPDPLRARVHRLARVTRDPKEVAERLPYIVVMERTHSLTSFSDDELLRRLSDLLGRSRRDEADLVAHIGEVDRRRLFAREASPSMFAY